MVIFAIDLDSSVTIFSPWMKYFIQALVESLLMLSQKHAKPQSLQNNPSPIAATSKDNEPKNHYDDNA